MLADRVNLWIPREGATLVDVHTNYVETSIVGGASKTVYAF